MKKTALRAVSLTFAVGVLAAVVGRAGLGTAGCRPASYAGPQAASPASPTATVADPAPPPPPERYFPATKAAPVFYPYDTPPAPPPQQAAATPQGQVRK